MATIENITDEVRDEIQESLEDAQAEIKALIREIDNDSYISQEGWIECIERINGHLATVRGRVRTLR